MSCQVKLYRTLLNPASVIQPTQPEHQLQPASCVFRSLKLKGKTVGNESLFLMGRMNARAFIPKMWSMCDVCSLWQKSQEMVAVQMVSWEQLDRENAFHHRCSPDKKTASTEISLPAGAALTAGSTSNRNPRGNQTHKDIGKDARPKVLIGRSRFC